jgi:LuxR family transcriptional regulator, maltose regulon positive regulatory protein
MQRDALQLATSADGQTLPIAAGVLVGMGNLLYEWNDLDAAAHHIEQSVELSKLWGNADNAVACSASLARLRQAQGDRDAAARLLDDAGQTVELSSVDAVTQSHLAAQRMRFFLACNDAPSAQRLAENRGLSRAFTPSPMREVEAAAYARLLAVDDPAGALNVLDRLLIVVEERGHKRRAIEMLATQSGVLQAQGKVTRALAVLSRALTLAEPEQYVRTFLDEGAPMLDLLRHAGSRGLSPRYVARLLAPSSVPANESKHARQPLLEALSERELEVLRLIEAGLSNQGIADRLVVALGTVKAHTSSIYRKLGVDSRTQAVQRARDLCLL